VTAASREATGAALITGMGNENLPAKDTEDTAPAHLIADDTATDHRSHVWQRHLTRRVVAADISAVAVAGVCAAGLVMTPAIAVPGAIGAALATVAAAAWLGVSTWARRRDRGLAIDGLVRVGSPVLASAAAFVATCVMLALLGTTLPLAVLLAPFLAGALTGLIARSAVRRWAIREHAAGDGRRTVLLVGTSAEISTLGPALTAMGNAVEVLGACVTDTFTDTAVLLDYETHSQASVRTIPVLGTADRVQDIVCAIGADTVLLTSTPKGAGDGLSALAWQLDRIGTTLSLLSSTNDIDDSRVQREVIGSTTLVHIARPTYRGALRAGKRLTDLAASAILLLVLGLPMLAVAAAIRLTSRGPAIFAQERIGLNGEAFTMLKFRSMVEDAEDRLDELQNQQDAGNTVMFKMRDDPRVTRIGRLLRRTSLDELPQLVNVLRGDMSLVGPRPPLATELAQYDDNARRRFLVKPGITGLWQVSGRSDLTWEQTVRCDRRYVENWSVAKDASIAMRTIRAMNKGAY